MDLSAIIRTLYVEKAKVENSIAALEALHATHGNRPERAGRRGRKSMGDEERQQVSERMKKYWGSRREQQTTLAVISSN